MVIDAAAFVVILVMCMPQRDEILRLTAADGCDWLNGSLAFSFVGLEDWRWDVDVDAWRRRGDTGAGIRRTFVG